MTDPVLAPLDAIFSPRSIAVVGATRAAGTVPHDIFQNILEGGFQGTVYPVSPGAKSIRGVKAYKYVLDVPDPFELAVLVFPSSVCHLAMEQCGQRGVRAAIVISAGFREVGEAGRKREQQLKAIADNYGIRIIGPNCLGGINTDPKVQLNASFARKMPEQGSIAFVSQSGALCTAVLDYARGKHIGFSKFVSFGNKCDLSEVDLIQYLGDDPATNVILVYLEEITDARGLLQAARTVIQQTGKPILALKSGRTAAGASAAASHTGSLAGPDEFCDAIFQQAGIQRCRTIEDMFNRATALAYQPRPKTNRVAIITNAGGPGVMATDAAIDYGLEMAQFSQQTRDSFKRKLPPTANTQNPVDIIGDARSDRYKAALSSILADPDVAGAMVILTPQSMTDIREIAEEVVRTAQAMPEKPLYTSFMGEADVAEGIEILQRHHIPHYILPESMAAAMTASYQFELQTRLVRQPLPPQNDVDTATARGLLEQAFAEGRKHLPEVEAGPILAAYGLPLLPGRVARSPEEAVATAQAVGCPVAMKIDSPDVVHKVDAGGVALNVAEPAAAADIYRALVQAVQAARPEARIRGVHVQKMAHPGQEVILGIQRDPVFGPMIMFGLGGTLVEVFRDVAFRAVPLDLHDLTSMVRQIKSYPLLEGTRGRPPCDVPALENAIQRLAQLAVDCPQIIELDLNPVIVQGEGQGISIADARILL